MFCILFFVTLIGCDLDTKEKLDFSIFEGKFSFSLRFSRSKQKTIDHNAQFWRSICFHKYSNYFLPLNRMKYFLTPNNFRLWWVCAGDGTWSYQRRRHHCLFNIWSSQCWTSHRKVITRLSAPCTGGYSKKILQDLKFTHLGHFLAWISQFF